MNSLRIIYVIICFFGANAFVQVQAQTKIRNSVIGSGATSTGNASTKLQGTVGQTIIGKVSNINNIESGFWAQTIELVTSVESIAGPVVPAEYQLHQNYPNPFNPTTTIAFDVPRQSHITLKIYNILGNEMAILVDDDFTPGGYKATFEASDLATGVYFYRLEGDGFVATKKLALVK